MVLCTSHHPEIAIHSIPTHPTAVFDPSKIAFLSSSSLRGFAQSRIGRWHTLGYGSLMCIISVFTDIAYSINCIRKHVEYFKYSINCIRIHVEYFKYSIILYTYMLNISNLLSCCIRIDGEYFNNPTAPHPYDHHSPIHRHLAFTYILTEFTWIHPPILLCLQTLILSLYLRIIVIVTI